VAETPAFTRRRQRDTRCGIRGARQTRDWTRRSSSPSLGSLAGNEATEEDV
jgi:hypothetical protein